MNKIPMVRQNKHAGKLNFILNHYCATIYILTETHERVYSLIYTYFLKESEVDHQGTQQYYFRSHPSMIEGHDDGS